jgi:hypothetical protein
MLVCSVGNSPTGVKVRSPVAWIAGRKETESLKPIDKAILWMVSESPGRNAINPIMASKPMDPKAEPSLSGRRQNELLQLTDAAGHFGGVIGTAR